MTGFDFCDQWNSINTHCQHFQCISNSICSVTFSDVRLKNWQNVFRSYIIHPYFGQGLWIDSYFCNAHIYNTSLWHHSKDFVLVLPETTWSCPHICFGNIAVMQLFSMQVWTSMTSSLAVALYSRSHIGWIFKCKL